MNRTYLIYNPQAGALRGRPDRLRETVSLLQRALGDVVELPTTAPGSATDQARRCAEKGAARVLVAGGDGTINETLNGLIGTGVPLGFLPGGTANVLAMETGVGGDLRRAARAIASAVPVPVTTCLVSQGELQRHFLLMAGIGLDARIVKWVSPAAKRRLGKASYWLAGFAQLGRRLPEFDVSMDGGEAVRCSYALASRVKNYGGDLEIATHASLLRDDLAVVLFGGPGSLPYLKYFSGVLFKRLDGMSGVTLRHARSLEVRPADPPVDMQVDGEWIGAGAARLEVAPRSLVLLLPPAFLNGGA